MSDPVLDRYPQARPIIPGYSYDFGRFHVSRHQEGQRQHKWKVTFPEDDGLMVYVRDIPDAIKTAGIAIANYLDPPPDDGEVDAWPEDDFDPTLYQ